jgi:hypothetical protein
MRDFGPIKKTIDGGAPLPPEALGQWILRCLGDGEYGFVCARRETVLYYACVELLFRVWRRTQP